MTNRDGDTLALSAVTGLILETFRLNGALIASGDALVAPIGLTSARWQVLGAIDAASGPLPVAHIARNMGLSRQGVQRLANEMEKDGLLTFAANPHHKRAPLAVMTAKGRETFRAAMALQRQWAAALARDIPPQELRAASALMNTLRSRLEDE